MWNKYKINMKQIQSKNETNTKWMWNKYNINTKLMWNKYKINMKQILGGLARANMRRAVTTVINSSQLHSHGLYSFLKRKWLKKHNLRCFLKKKISQKPRFTQETEVSLFELFEDTTFPNTGGIKWVLERISPDLWILSLFSSGSDNYSAFQSPAPFLHLRTNPVQFGRTRSP